MSLKESLIDRNKSHKKSKTQKFDFNQKKNHITIKATEVENHSNQINKNSRHSLMFGNENINATINPFYSYNFNPETNILNNENQKSQEPLPPFSRANKKKTIKLSPSKLKNVLDTLNNNNKTLNNNKSKESEKVDKYLYPKKNKNYINFLDRNKIRNIKLTNLNIFKEYLNEKVMSSQEHNLKAGLLSSLNMENTNTNSKRNPKKSIIELALFSNNNALKRARTLYNRRLKKLSLHELMEINPYHYVSNKVKFSKRIEMGLISDKLGDMDSGNSKFIAKNNISFFPGKSSKKSKNNRVIETFQVSYNKNLLHKSGLVWRILQKFYVRRKAIIPSFKLACKFKAYTELWKYHSMLIEKLLVNYSKFKWFLEKNKYIREEVFEEFIGCKKLEGEIKGEISFSKKVFLAFDDAGIGLINIKVFFLIMEITSKSGNILEKVSFICDLIEEFELINEPSSVNVMDMYDLFKYLLVYENAQKDGKGFLESIKEELNGGEKLEENIYINKNELYEFLVNNRYFLKIFQGFKIQYKYAEINYIEEVNSCFNSTVRNVKKFLNEQNEVISDCEKDYYKFENVLQSIQDKTDKKEKIKIFLNELEKDETQDEYQE